MFENIYKVSNSFDPDIVEWRNYKDPNKEFFNVMSAMLYDKVFCVLVVIININTSLM